MPHLTLLAVQAHLSYFQAIVMGLLQGVTELFPVSSLGHSVLIPALLGWDNLTKGQSNGESFFLAFVVGLHVGTAVALIAYYWRTWLGLTGGLFTSVRDRSLAKPNERLIWLIILATIPVGIIGLAFEHKLRTQFAKPLSAAIFLTINGVLLLGAEVLRRRTLARGGRIRLPKGKHAVGAAASDDEATSFRRLESLPLLWVQGSAASASPAPSLPGSRPSAPWPSSSGGSRRGRSGPSASTAWSSAGSASSASPEPSTRRVTSSRPRCADPRAPVRA